MRGTLRVLIGGAALVAALAACRPTGDVRCDRLIRGQQILMEQAGYRLICNPPPDEDPTGYYWGRTSNPEDGRVHIWPDRIYAGDYPHDDLFLRKIAQHELGHVLHWGWTERQVEGWAWCTDPQHPIAWAYEWRPTPAECATLLAR